MSISAEILSIGDELTSGQRLDTNSRWLSQRLNELGVTVTRHTTIADDFQSMMSAFAAAVRRSKVVVSSGGLGPTGDDLTRQVMADLAQSPLQLDPASLEHIKSLFLQRKREMPESNIIQAKFPRGSKIILNEHGTAPGIDLIFNTDGFEARFFALPGVPAELHRMWHDYVDQQIKTLMPSDWVICHRHIHCFGAGESEIESRIPDLVRRGRHPQVGITASKATITLRITAQADTHEACEAMIQPTSDLIQKNLGDLVFGHGDTTLEQVVVHQLQQQNRTLGIVDGGLNGIVTSLLSDADQSSNCIAGGWSIQNVADVQTTAKSAQKLLDCDLVLVIGKLQRAESDAYRDVWLIGDEVLHSTQLDAHCHPDLVQVRSAKQVLNWLRLVL